MYYGISKSVSQRGGGEESQVNRRINEIADELRRCCHVCEVELRDGKSYVSQLEVEQRIFPVLRGYGYIFSVL